MLMTQEREYITIPQAAKVAGVSRTIIERWIATGRIRKYQRAGGSYPLVKVSEVEAAAAIVPADDDAPHEPR